MAPVEEEVTNFAYLARYPLVILGWKGFSAFFRLASSGALTFKLSFLREYRWK